MLELLDGYVSVSLIVLYIQASYDSLSRVLGIYSKVSLLRSNHNMTNPLLKPSTFGPKQPI